MAESNPWGLILQVAPFVRRMLLWGKRPGTGKTTAGIMLAAARKVRATVITLTDAMTASDLLGHWIPRGGEFVWHDGPITRAIREAATSGAVLVLNELDHAGPDVSNALYWLFEKGIAAQCTLPSGETLTIGRNLSIIATMNADPECLPEAVRNRFQVRINVGDNVAPALLEALPKSLASMVADGRIEAREAFAMLDLIDEGCPSGVAVEAVLGSDRAADYGDALAIALA